MRVYLHIMTHLFLAYHSKNQGNFYYKEVYSQLCCSWLCMKLENWNVSQSSQSQVYVFHNHHDVCVSDSLHVRLIINNSIFLLCSRVFCLQLLKR